MAFTENFSWATKRFVVLCHVIKVTKRFVCLWHFNFKKMSSSHNVLMSQRDIQFSKLNVLKVTTERCD